MILAPSSLTISRYGATTYADGRPVYPTPSSVAVVAGVAPAPQSSIRRLPEGVAVDRAVDVYAHLELRTADEAAGSMADRFTYDGRVYEVQAVRAFPALAGQPAKWVATATVVSALTYPEGTP